MLVKPLTNTSLSEIVDALLKAFTGYFVKLPSEVSYWESRFNGARVRYDLSFGAFAEGKLVGFIINGLDTVHNECIAFNTGTGVISEYRGRKIVDQLYEAALPEFKRNGVQKCLLEVIQQNKKAIRVYERIGFVKTRSLQSYQGKILGPVDPNLQLMETSFEMVFSAPGHLSHLYSWDFMDAGIIQTNFPYVPFFVLENDEKIGYFILHKGNGTVAQLEAFQQDYKSILQAISLNCRQIRIINVDEKRKNLIRTLRDVGLSNTVSQYEMEWTPTFL